MTGTSAACSWPVTRSTRASAMICPVDRSSPPVCRADSAASFSAAYVWTPSATGSSAVRYVMVSGAGRMVTHRSETAFAARLARAAGSSWLACSLMRPTSRRFPTPSSTVGSAQSSASMAWRSARSRHAVSLTSSVARSWDSRPARSAFRVCGISVCQTFATPSSDRARCGETRSASPTCWATLASASRAADLAVTGIWRPRLSWAVPPDEIAASFDARTSSSRSSTSTWDCAAATPAASSSSARRVATREAASAGPEPDTSQACRASIPSAVTPLGRTPGDPTASASMSESSARLGPAPPGA